MISDPTILYEDSSFVAAVKPFGTICESGPFVESLREKLHCPSLYCVHRLDKVCGGLILFAKSTQASAAFSSLFASGDIAKTYLAVAEGVAEEVSGRMEDLLFHESGRNKTFVVDRVRKGVRSASLEYTLLEQGLSDQTALSLYAVRLFTGRTHQIRVQFASRMLPLYGDAKYGAANRRRSVALWSYRISFRHPVSGEQLQITSVPPQTEPWDLFTGTIQDL